MDWKTWEPLYREILQEFHFDRKLDEEARDLAAVLLSSRPRPDIAALRKAAHGRGVCIAGPKPTKLPDAPLIATDAAMAWLPRAQLPLAIVTDMDGDVDAQVGANARGAPLFLHAHGDNRDTLRRVAPMLRGPVQPTTQAYPASGVANYGGFTDGDRACCLAAHLGARSLVLAGFDFDAPVPKPGVDASVKARKLRWAKRIIDQIGIPYRIL